MGERKAWSKEEDEALKNIITIREVKKWSHISKIMESEYDIFGRSGKQCRERWHNQLDPAIKSSEWTMEEERILFENHNVFGNKWARISEELEGRTDNCVKNHFYSTLRRAFRRLNQHICRNKQRLGIKELKIVIMSKLVAAAEEKFISKLKLSDEIIRKSIQLKNRLVPFSKEVENTEQDEVVLEALIREILQFTKSFKRKKAKKQRVCDDGEDDLYNDESISVREDSEDGDIPISEHSMQPVKVQPREAPVHQNLFSYSQCQVVIEKETYDEAKESINGFQMIQKHDSKIMDDAPLQMLKKGSNFSTWSGVVGLPPLRERTSQFSFNRMDSGFILDGSFHMGNLFGCDLEQLN